MLAALSLLAACGEGEGAGPAPPSPAPPPAPAPAPAPPPAPAPTFTIGGTVSGLAGGSLVLQNNVADDLAVSSNGSFTFAGKLATGAAYAVTIKTQPASTGQTCTVAGGSGTLAAADVANVAVTCAAPPPMNFKVGGTVSGLSGALVLQNNGADNLTLTANGAFSFAGLLPAGSNYNVGVTTQPAGQDCTISNGSGTIASADVGDVGVRCAQKLQVTSTTPVDRATEVSRTATLSVLFSADVDAASINDLSITLASAAGAKKLQFATTGSHVVITPASNLMPNAQYTLTINTAVRGSAGGQLAAVVTRTFRTRDGAWSAPQAIQLPSSNGSLPEIAVDAAGNAVAVWCDSPGIGMPSKPTANRYVAGSGWGTPVTIPSVTDGVLYPRVAMDGAGNAFAIWLSNDAAHSLWTIETSRYAVDVGWDPAISNGATVAADNWPQVAADANGNAIEVWGESNGATYKVWLRHYIAGSGWQTDLPLQTEDGDAREQQIAIDKDGNAMAIWEQKSTGNYDLYARRYIPGAGWNEPEPLETADESAGSPQVAWDGAGNAIAVWQQPTPNFGPWSIWSNRFDNTLGWGTAATLVEHIELAPGGVPALAVDPAGNAIAVWQHLDLSRSATDIWSNVWTPGTGWANERQIETQKKENANHAQVAVDSSGNAIAVWMEDDGTRPNIWANRYLPGTGWGTAQLLEHDDGWAGYPQIAIDAAGNAFAIWQQSSLDGRQSSIYVARFE